MKLKVVHSVPLAMCFCVCLCVGMILMSVRYTSERRFVCSELAPQLVDPENTHTHLLPYLACESSSTRELILAAITAANA